jgi:hypothetical protein
VLWGIELSQQPPVFRKMGRYIQGKGKVDAIAKIVNYHMEYWY